MNFFNKRSIFYLFVLIILFYLVYRVRSNDASLIDNGKDSLLRSDLSR